VPEFQGVKLSQDVKACTDYPVNKINVVRNSSKILTDIPATVSVGSANGGGNSGFQCFNLAVQFGVRRIVLVGFDMRLDHGTHWHGKHPKGLNNPGELLMIHWRKAFNDAAREVADLGVEVINASPISLITAYPVMPLRAALGA
jgi:hypothetical protein